MEEKQIDIDCNKFFNFPTNISIQKIPNGIYLIIDTDSPNWITLINEVELNIFTELNNGKTINKLLEDYQQTVNKINFNKHLSNVLIEIHDNDFFENDEIKINDNNYNLTLYLTDKCNQKCNHCYRYNQKSKIELSTTEWKKVLKQFSKLKNRGEFVTFSGGEVTIRKDFEELLEYSKSLGLKNIVLTNGTYIKPKSYNNIVKYSHEIQISLDGIYKEQNDRIRGKGTFSKIMDTLVSISDYANLYNKNLRLALAMTFMPDDLSYINKNIQYFTDNLENKLNREIIYRVSTRLKLGRNINALSIDSQNEYRNTTIDIKNKIYKDDFWENKLFYASNFSQKIRIVNCGFGQNIGVHADGNVLACSEFNDEFMGNVTKVNLESIQNKLYSIYQKTSVNNMHDCKECNIKYICGGGCRIDNKKLNGTFLIPSNCKEDTNFKDFIYKIMAEKRTWSWN